VAQIGAAIGREFSHALLAAVMGKPEAVLGSVLDRLTAAGLLFQQGVPSHAAICSNMPSCRTQPGLAISAHAGDTLQTIATTYHVPLWALNSDQ
jgi:hypothetical protein